jgi:hypothetical protein
MRRRGDPAEGARRAMHWRPHACMGEQTENVPPVSLPLASYIYQALSVERERGSQYQWHRLTLASVPLSTVDRVFDSTRGAAVGRVA